MNGLTKIQFSIIFSLSSVFPLYAQNMQISGGHEHTVTLCKAAGVVMHTGARNNNQDGTGVWSGTNTVLTPVPGIGGVGSLSNIGMVDAGSTHHSIALTKTGDVVAFGNDYACQLGQGGTGGSYPPYPVYVKGLGGVGTLSGMKYIVGSSESSYAIRASDGALIGWGNNTQGQLGLGTITPQECTPQLVNSPLNSNVVMVDGGDNFTLALKSDGTVWGMGENVNGQLGIGNTTDQSVPTQVLIAPGVPLTNVVNISCGDGSSYAIKSDGTLWAWGYNGVGCLGIGNCVLNAQYAVQVTALSNVKQVVGGNKHAVVLLNNGDVYTMGSDQSGQLGDGTVGGADACALTEGCRNIPFKVPTLSNIASVSEGDHWSFAVDNNGLAYSWGENNLGQLGIGSSGASVPTPTAMNMSNCTVVLPVELANFQASPAGAESMLTWTTASEKSTARFEIQRSTDNLLFTTIGTVPAAGNSSSILSYSFSDHLEGIYASSIYYRIKTVDINGESSYSDVKAVNFDENSAIIFKNPIGKDELFQMNLFCDKTVENMIIQVYDMTGKNVFFGEFTLKKGENRLILPMNLASAGMYILKSVRHSQVKDFKLIIQ
ncbi:MAG: T9SS type A sorting domain-containing protein [Cytophagaceae bacterium]